jgi:hypothetical protein
MEVESVLWFTMSETRRLSVIRATHVADTPGSITLLTARGYLIGLTVNAWISYQHGLKGIAKVVWSTNRGP